MFESGKVESLNKAISTFLGLSDEEKIRMKNSNRMLYETRCSIECFAKASAAIIIGAIFLGISYLMTHREVMKKVWN